MKKVLAVLGLQAFVFHNNFFGGGEAHVKMTKEQLEKIDAELEKGGTGADAKTVADLKEQVSGFEAKEDAVQEALTAAMELNGIEAVEGQSPAEAIAELGAKCKEFGEATNTHSLTQTDGKDKKPNADQSGNYAHNQVFNDDKFKTLK